MPPSHSCRCERCWTLITDCLSSLSTGGLHHSYCLVFSTCIQVALHLKLYLSLTLVRFSPCASIPVAVWAFLPHPTLCHGFSLCFAILLLAWTFWPRHFLAPALRYNSWFDFDCCNSVTQRWHQLLAGFRFEANETRSLFELAETWKLALWDICSAAKLIANCLRGS